LHCFVLDVKHQETAVILSTSEHEPQSGSAIRSSSNRWHGELHLDFQARIDAHNQLERTVLNFEHQGPLRIQKALYPDGMTCCHAVIIHPPGGIAAGDFLVITIDVAEIAQALITTPSATKWYGAYGGTAATQHIEMNVKGHLQWLPAETIVYDHAVVDSVLTMDIALTGSVIGWDTLIYGRHGSGELFSHGAFNQTLRLLLDGEVVWIERLRLLGNDPLFESPVGLQGHHALATCWVVVPADAVFSDDCLADLRAHCPGVAFTRLHPRVLVGRLLGEPIDLRTQLEATWQWLSTHLLHQSIGTPRLWAT
jgi:urease accessory protein